VRLDGAGYAVGVANNGLSGFDAGPGGTLRLSLSRGAVHCSWEGDPGSTPLEPAQSYTWMDQEQIDTCFRLVGGAGAVDAALVRAAQTLNQPPDCFFTYYPPTPPASAASKPSPFLKIEAPGVVLAALKQAEDADGLLVRLVETLGCATDTQVTLDGAAPQHIHFGPYEIKTFKLIRKGEGVQWQPVDLTERPSG
jgi:alpha-mannosidase